MTEQELTHHGIKGMKWGVRRYQPYAKGSSVKGIFKKTIDANTKAKAKLDKINKKQKIASDKKLVKSQKAWDKHTKENWLTVYNETVNTANKTIVPKINAKYAKYDWTKLDLSSGSPKGDPKLVANYKKYESEHADAFDSLLNKNYDDVFGKRPT